MAYVAEAAKTCDILDIRRRPAEQRAGMFAASPEVILIIAAQVYDAIAITAQPFEISLDLSG